MNNAQHEIMETGVGIYKSNYDNPTVIKWARLAVSDCHPFAYAYDADLLEVCLEIRFCDRYCFHSIVSVQYYYHRLEDHRENALEFVIDTACIL